MKTWYWRTRYYAMVLAAGGLFVLQGCGLSDRQLSSVWESVVATGLNTLVANLLTALTQQAAA